VVNEEEMIEKLAKTTSELDDQVEANYALERATAADLIKKIARAASEGLDSICSATSFRDPMGSPVRGALVYRRLNETSLYIDEDGGFFVPSRGLGGSPQWVDAEWLVADGWEASDIATGLADAFYRQITGLSKASERTMARCEKMKAIAVLLAK
jgi:hypothetical protein